ncbi:MAG: putative dynamin family protein [Streblomastix strix]|uniref:Putative dynamin family protein n=1 Tax=Streblomastix strix TaxID=222440 RepID=A0A5J4W8W9_9EUKA|nr:MAG: putative dynamin family protein [Streblomastix strix]
MDLGMSEDELLIQVRNSLGVNSTLFVPEKCFLLLAVRQIERLRQPSMRCLDATHRECIRILGQSLDQVKGPERFPKLKRRLLEEATQMVAGMRKKAEEILNYLIDIEEAYINIKHPDFDAMRCLTAVVEEREKQKNMNAQNPQRRGQQSYDQLMQAVSNQDAIKVELVRRLVLLYFAIVRKSIGDSVPKSVMNFLVNKSAKEIQNQLMRNLYKESLFQELMAEDDGITKRRIMCNERRNVLKEAMNILDDVSFQADTYSITEGTEGVAEDGHVTEEVYFREKRQKEQEKAKLAKEHDREKQWDQNKDSNVFSSGPLRSFQDGQQQGYTQKGRAGSPSQQTSTSQQDISYDQQGQTKYPSYSPSGIQPRIQGQAVPESLNQYDSSSTGVSSSTSKQNLSQSLRPPPSISPSQQQQYTKGVGSATVADANAIMSLFGSPTLNTSSSTFSQDSDKKDDDKDSIKKKEHRHHRDKDKDKDKSKDDDNDEKLNVLQQQQLKDKQKKKDKEGK